MAPLMHDMYFNIPDFQLTQPILWARANGVIWNTTWESTTVNGTSGSNGSGSGCFVLKPQDNTWNQESSFGAADTTGERNVYIEDSVIKNIYNQAIDVDDDRRVTIRYTTFCNSQGLSHGTTSMRGGRQVELHNNNFQYRSVTGGQYSTVNLNRYWWLRAGTQVVTDNNFEAINTGDWGNKDTLVYIVECATRPGAGCPSCCTSYPCTHQPGTGGSGTGQTSDPVYIWNNSGTVRIGMNDQSGYGCSGHNTSEFFIENRDYFVNAAKPGYVKYTYPHPLRGGSDGIPPSAPNLRIP